MIDVQIGNTADEAVKLNKTFNIRETAQCEIATPIDIMSPVLRFSDDTILLDSDNYFFIPYLKRFYFKGKVERDGNFTNVSLIADVLMSFREQIVNCQMIAERSSNIFNGFLSDSNRNFLTYSHNTFKDLGYFTGERKFLMGVG